MADENVSEIIQLVATIKRESYKYYNTNIILREQLNFTKNELNKKDDELKTRQKDLEDMQKLIEEQQFTINKLMEVKNDYNNQKLDLKEKNKTITELLKEIEILNQQHCSEMDHFRQEYEEKVNKSRDELSTIMSDAASNSKHFQDEIDKIKAEKDEQLTMIIMEYEEKLQKADAEIASIRDELKISRERSNANVMVYHQKLQEMEFKLKQKNNQNTNLVSPIVFKTPEIIPNTPEKPKKLNKEKFKQDIDKMVKKTMNFNPPENNIAKRIKSFNENSKTNTERNFSPLQVTIAPMNIAEREIQKKTTKRKLFNKYNDDYIASPESNTKNNNQS